MWLKNVEDQLYYEVVLTGTGTAMAVSWGSVGVAVPPAYAPTAGEPLVSQAQYEAVTGLTVTDVTRFLWVSLMVSDAVEAYLCRSYRVAQTDPLALECDDTAAVVTPVPPGLVCAICLCIRDAMALALGRTNAGFKSETLKGYSYTLADGVAVSDAVSAYTSTLKPWRRLYLGA